MARVPGFHPGCPGSTPGQGNKVSLQATVHCASESNISEYYFSHKTK